MLTLTNVTDYTLDSGRNPGVDRDILPLPEVLIQEPAPNIPTVLRPLFDALWQAGGEAECQDYGPDGTWTPRA